MTCFLSRLRVSWRHARGIISSDDSFFTGWDAPLLDRAVLDPIREEDAGKATFLPVFSPCAHYDHLE